MRKITHTLTGTGSKDDPFLITSKADLRNLLLYNNLLNNSFFKQMADIRFDKYEYWTPCGQKEEPFNCTYNGNGFSIEGLNINLPNNKNVGLFGYSENLEIKNLSLINVNIVGKSGVGGLVGHSPNIVVENCSVSGNAYGEFAVGLIAGIANYKGKIKDCNSSGEVRGFAVGGLVGILTISISNSFYAYKKVKINNKYSLSAGCISDNQYEAWLKNNKTLDISKYLNVEDEMVKITSIRDLKLALPFFQGDYRFQLTQDLDFSNEDNFYIPYFSGKFNGFGYKILNYSLENVFYLNTGFFSYVFNGEIFNLGFEKANVSGKNNVGILIGATGNSKTNISRCYVKGKVAGTAAVGGLVGFAKENVKISNCFASCICSSLNDLTKKQKTYRYFGGIIGKSGWNIEAINCYSNSKIYNEELVSSLNCNTLWGNWPYIVENVYCNGDLMNSPDYKKDYILTTDQLKTESSFKKWDFKKIWIIDNNNNKGYPYLKEFIKNE